MKKYIFLITCLIFSFSFSQKKELRNANKKFNTGDVDGAYKIINSNKKFSMNYNLHIAIAPTKKIDRFEWFLEKAIEIGVSSITPLICKYNERKSLNYLRNQEIQAIIN